MTTVSRRVTYNVIAGDGLGSTGKVDLRYDTARPLQVELGFGLHSDGSGQNVWTVARDVLACRVEGTGDYRCWVDGMWFHLLLANRNGSNELRMLTAPVFAFLAGADRLIPYGTEVVSFDAALEALLKTGGNR